MLYRVTRDGASAPVRIEGEIDMASAEAFEQELLTFLDDGQTREVNMSGVSFIDSAGLHALYRCSQKVNGTGPLVIVDPSRFVSSLMQIVGFDDSDDIVLARHP